MNLKKNRYGKIHVVIEGRTPLIMNRLAIEKLKRGTIE
jgi:hypothetical protein